MLSENAEWPGALTEPILPRPDLRAAALQDRLTLMGTMSRVSSAAGMN